MAMIAIITNLYMGHAATKPDKVNISITKDFKDHMNIIYLVSNVVYVV